MKKSIFYSHICDAARQRGVPVEQVLAEAKQLGFEGLECDHNEISADPAGFARMVRNAGFVVCSVPCHIGFHKGVDIGKIQKLVADTVTVGCRKILAIPGYLSDEDPGALERMVDGLALLCEAAEKEGITVTLEDFDNEKSPCATADGIRYFFERVPALRFNLDTGNFLYMDQDVTQCCLSILDKVAHVHLKDRSLKQLNVQEQPSISVGGTALYPCPVGEGVIPMAKVIDMLKDVGYDGFCTAEHFNAADQWDYITRSAQWLDNYL